MPHRCGARHPIANTTASYAEGLRAGSGEDQIIANGVPSSMTTQWGEAAGRQWTRSKLVELKHLRSPYYFANAVFKQVASCPQQPPGLCAANSLD